MIVAKDGRTAYFASSFFNEDRNDLDLYTFDLPQESRSLEVAYIQGLITDSKTNNPIKADIELVNLKSGKSIKVQKVIWMGIICFAFLLMLNMR